MPGPIQRNAVVKFFGTPDATEGSVNEPRIRAEHGFSFNEKWTYCHPLHDPANAAERIVYWQRYDFVGSVTRAAADADWEPDDSLSQALGGSAHPT